MRKLYVCMAILAHYDNLDAETRRMIDVTIKPFIVEAESEEAAILDIRELFSYNKQYFEYRGSSVIEIKSSDILHFFSQFVKKYSDICVGEKYRLVSEDVFTKGSEGWEADSNWLVIPESSRPIDNESKA
jgi:hypothetical protein